MEVGILTTETSETESRPGEGDSLESFDELKLKEFIAEGNLDFDGWTSLIAEVESLCADEVDKICLVYDSFLSEFPLCYGYWRKYAEHMIRLCTEEKAVEVFERAVQSATYSVGVWVDYCGFAISVFEDADDVRRLFKRAMSFVGKDYLCHTLWDKYVEFEFSQQEWSNLAHVYIQTLRFPSKKLHRYYESFQKLVATWKEDMPGLNDLDLQSDCKADHEGSTCYTDDEISCVIKDLLNPSTGVDVTNALEKYFSIGKVFYKEASQLDENIHRFESSIKRPYFHVKPLDISQLENWHDYLNFIEMHSDFDWAVKLYERCLIPCANYPEFWMRYVDYMESKGGRELANFALARATQIFLKRMPVIHLFSARFKEKIRDVSGAHEALLGYETESDLSFVETVSIRANMEKRLGNFVAASNTYKEAVEIATAKEKFDVLPMLYVNFSRLQYMITNNSDAARDILIEGIKRVPHCKLLLEELIKFGMMHGGSRDIHVFDAIINDVISLGLSQGMDAKAAEDISNLYLQFVDLCGTLDDIRKAWKRHMKSFPDSARTSTNSVTGIKPIPNLKMTAGGRQGSLGALPSDPSGDGSFDIPTRSPPLDKVMKSLENDDTQPNNAASDCVSDKKSPLQENHEIPSDQATFNRLQSGEAESLQGEMEHRSQAVSEQLREDVKANTGMSSPDSMQEVTNEVEVLPTSEENSKESDVQKEPDHKSEQDLNHLSLERLSLDHNKSLDCDRVTNQEGETIIDTSLSNESMGKSEPQETGMFDESVPEVGQSNDGDHLVSSPRSGRASDSAGIQTEMASPSSSVNQTNIKKTESVSRRSPPYGGRSWHQRSNADRGHRDNKFGFRRHSHKRMHQRRQFSPQRQYPQNETGTQVPMNQGYPSQSMSSQSPQVQQGGLTQNQYSASAAHPNSMAANAWSMQNMQQQSFDPSQSQFLPLPAYPQPQISPQPMQSNQQLGEMQNNQAYNQMWQYYFYQQQQQQHQFLSQQQQQSQNQHPQAQQQLLQQQYHQHQQMLQVQQQQVPYQHPQLLQLQQQQQFIQHQQQQYMQQQHQMMQQQGSYPQQLPPQNHLYLQQQQQQGQEQRQQEQVTASQVQTRNELSKEGQDKLSHRADATETAISQKRSSPSQ